ncbi:MFS transporter [Streptomyces sp. NPDC096142]|uniref:MFS transporter n=1 Tax=Streptomyces sp. NPDC096142 TaxID=3366077 RepID=UPI0038076445
MTTDATDAPQRPAPDRPVAELVRNAAYWRWVAATMLHRLPPIMAPMALIWASTHYTGSPAVGGLLVGLATLPCILAAPLFSRLLERWGRERWTPRVLALGGAARLGVAGGFVAHAPVPVLFALSLVGNMATFGVGGAIRTLLRTTVPQRLIGSALSLDAVLVELVVVGAPFVVVVCALFGPAYALFIMGAAMLTNAVLLWPRPKPVSEAGGQASGKEAAEADADDGIAPDVPESAGVWRNPAFLFWALVTMAFGHFLGTAEVGALPRVALSGGGTTEAAILTGVLGASSAAAGLVYAWYVTRIRLSLSMRAVALLLTMTAGCLVIAEASGWWALVGAFAMLGLCAAPLNSVMTEAPGYVVPRSRMSEAFSVLVATQSIGYSFAGGLLAVVSVHHMLLLGPVTAVLALLAAVVLRPARAAAALGAAAR